MSLARHQVVPRPSFPPIFHALHRLAPGTWLAPWGDVSDVFIALLKAYQRHGFRIRTGLNPLYFDDADGPFTRLLRADGTAVNVGGGIAPQEIHFLQCLFASGFRPERILIIGNAFGWSTLALGLLCSDSTVVAMDAGLEGEAARIGTDLTRTIAAEEGVDVRIVDALSPRDVATVVGAELGNAPVDFVFIDGLHTNEQLLRDFDAVTPHMASDGVCALHDVLSWHMVDAFNRLKVGPVRERRILTRCPSGMGLVFPHAIDPSVREVIDAFCDDTVDLDAYHHAVGATPERPGPTLVNRLAPCWRSRRVAMAGVYELEGESALADEQIALALDEAAGDPQTLGHIATCLIECERWDAAEAALRRVRELAPAWEVPAHQLGRVMREVGRYEEARSCFADASKLRPEWAVPLFDLGLVVQKLDGDATAARYFEEASHLDPRWAAPVFHLGLVTQSLSGDAAAAPHFELATQLNPEWAQPLRELGAARFRLGDVTAAIGHLEQSLVLEPGIAAAHHLLGLARRLCGGPRDAAPDLERAVAIEPDCAFMRFDLGIARRELNDPEASIHHLERATTLAPDWAPAWIEAATSATYVGRWSRAARFLVRAADLVPTDPALWRQIAQECAAAAAWEDALSAFRQLRRLEPGSRAIEKDIAICLRELGQLLESEAVLRNELTIRPEWAGAHFELGRTCEARHAWARAETAFERAIALRPRWQQPRDALARLRRRRAA